MYPDGRDLCEEAKSETYLVIDRIQRLLRSLDLVCTDLKPADERIIGFEVSIVEHGFLAEVLGIDPLQRDPHCGRVSGDLEVMAALDLELEAVLDIAGRVNVTMVPILPGLVIQRTYLSWCGF